MPRDRCVALLRGINIGPAKRVPMADLRAILGDLGYADVRTLLNSGNAVFTASRAEAARAAVRIHDAIAARLGVRTRVTVLRGAELQTIVDENPLTAIASDPARLLVGVLGAPSDRGRAEELMKQRWHPEVLAVGTRAVYMWCADGIAAGRLALAMDKHMGDALTARNWNTIARIRDAIAGDA